MADENKTPDMYNELTQFTQLDSNSLDDAKKQEYEDLINKIIDDVLSKETLSDNEFSAVYNAFSKSKSLFSETIKNSDKSADFIKHLQEIINSRTPNARGEKNNTDTIFNTLNSISRKETPTKSDQSKVKTAFKQLTDEIAKGRDKFNDKQKETLKTVYTKFKQEIDETYQKIKNPPVSLTQLYNEISGQNLDEVKNMQDLAKEFKTMLSDVYTQLTQDPQEEIQQETPQNQDSAPEEPEQNSEPEQDSVPEEPEQDPTPEEPEQDSTPEEPEPQEDETQELTLEQQEILQDFELKEGDSILNHVYEDQSQIKLRLLPHLKLLRNELDSRAEIKKDDIPLLPIVDDLVVANETLSKDERYAGKLRDLTIDRLSNLKAEDISPENAALYYYLCSQCNDSELRTRALKLIADALIKYDKEHFAQKDGQLIEADYSGFHSLAPDYNPFTKREPVTINLSQDSDTKINLSEVEFIGKSGHPLNIVEQNQKKQAVTDLARELAVQRLMNLDNVSEERFKLEMDKATAEILISSGIKTDGQNNGKIQVSIDSLSNSIANHYMEAESFKKRITQKFKNNNLVKEVKSKLDTLDKNLTDAYGEKYVTFKKVRNIVGKTAVQAGKTAIMYTAAGLVPGGTAVLIGYNMYKAIKVAKTQLKDNNLNKSKKTGIALSTATSLALQSIGMASGLSAIIPSESLPTIAHSLAPTVRMGIGAVATTVPNLIESMNIRTQQAVLKIKRKMTSDDDKKQALNESLKQLKSRAKDNRKDLLLKGVAVAVGTGTGLYVGLNTAPALREHISTFMSDLTSDAGQPNTTTNESNLVSAGATPQNTSGNYEPANHSEVTPEVKHHAQALIEGLHDQRYIDPATMADNISNHVGEKSDLAVMACRMAPYALQDVLHLDVANGTPTTHNMLQALASSELTTEQHQALEKFINENFDDTRFKTENFPNDYGPKATVHVASHEQAPASHETAHSSSSVKASNTEYHQSTHRATTVAASASTDQAHEPVDKYKFHHMDVEKTGNPIVDHLNKDAFTNGLEGKDRISMKYEPVEEMPYQDHDTNSHHAAAPDNSHNRQPARVEVIYDTGISDAAIAMYGSAAAAEYAMSHGYVVDPELTAYLNHYPDPRGGFHGWACVCIDPEHPGKRIIIPNDPNLDHVSYSNKDDCWRDVRYHHGPFKAHGPRILYGTGVPTQNGDAIHKVHGILGAVNHTLHTVDQALGTVRHAKDVFGGRH